MSKNSGPYGSGRTALGVLPFLGVRYSQLIGVPMSYTWSKKTYNNAVSALRLAFAFGFLDHPEEPNPAALMKCLRVRKKDRPRIDPFAIDEAERVIAAIHDDWGKAQGNYDEFRVFTGLRPSEQIAGPPTSARVARALSAGRPD